MINWKKPRKNFIIIFLLLAALKPAFAAGQVRYEITTPLPGLPAGSAPDLGSLIAILFQFSLGIVGLVAFAMVVYHGIRYVFGAANESLVSDAKDGLRQVVYGIILLFGSVVILNTINPCIVETVNFWSDSEATQRKCESSSFASGIALIPEENLNDQKSQEEFYKEKLNNEVGGVKITDTPTIIDSQGNIVRSGYLIVIGLDPETGEVKRLIVNSDGTFTGDTRIFTEEDVEKWQPSADYLAAGSLENGIHGYPLPFSELGNEKVLIATREFLLAEGRMRTIDYSNLASAFASDYNSFEPTPDFIFSFSEREYGDYFISAAGTCSEVGDSLIYYRCRMDVRATAGAESLTSTPPYFYISTAIDGETLDSNKTEQEKNSQAVVSGFFLAEVEKRVSGNF